MTGLLVVLGAMVGAPLRFVLGERLDSRRFPLGIWLANVLGSTVLGLVGGLGLGAHPMALIGTGFCGAFTTYSAFATETFDRGPRQGTAYAVATIAIALAGCAVGFWLGERLSG